MLAAIRERCESCEYLESFKGVPMVCICAALMSIAFFGFSGLNI